MTINRKLCWVLLLAAAAAFAEDWPQWRGPQANGISTEKNPPLEWSASRNLLWKMPLKGLGTSSPVVWGDRVFITTQTGDGPFDGRSHDFDNAAVARKTGNQGQVRFAVQAFSRRDGKLAWEYVFDASGHLQPAHFKHNLASPSCVTDGNLVYAWFGTGQLVALTWDGKLAWQRHIGMEYSPFEVLWAHGSSPLLYKNTIILLCEHPPASYILALDKRSGKEVWKADRGKDRRSYATPFIIPGPAGDEMVINSTERIDVVDPSTGKLRWWFGEPNRVPVPTPVFHDGVLYASRGYSSSPFLAVTTGGRGDVNATHVKWEVKTGAPYVSSLLHYQGLIYMATETGIVSCVDAADGKLVWRERFGGVFSASPVAADGKVYLVNENGEAFVLQAGREKKILARNTIPERTLASPAISGGVLFLRTDQSLIAIGSSPADSGAR